MFRPFAVLLGVLCLAFSPFSYAFADTLYTVTDLGTLGGTLSEATAVNNVGQIVGGSYVAGSTNLHGFLYQNRVMTDIGNLGSAAYTEAYGISDNGLVGGSSDTGHGQQPFLYDGTTMWSLGTLGGAGGGVSDVGRNGYAVGWSNPATDLGANHAFVYNGSIMKDLGTLGGRNSLASGVNASGLIVGYSAMPDGTQHAFLYQGSTMKDLGTIGGQNSSIHDINDAGLMAGWSEVTGGSQHAATYYGNQWHDLGTLGGLESAASRMNASGQVVGWADTVAGAEHAFIYSNGTMADLNNLIVTPGWTLQIAQAINDNGLIVGTGINPIGQTHGFLLAPIATPEPSTFILLSIGGVGLAGYAWWRRNGRR
jgi:probable HAF family extracellular repeat protein